MTAAGGQYGLARRMHNDSHIPSSNQLRNSVVCFGWRFPTFLAILLIWLDVAM